MTQTLWVTKPGTDLLIPAPAGAKSAVAATRDVTFLQGKEQALAVAQMYREAGIQLNRACDLSQHIAAACAASDHWLSGKDRGQQLAGVLFRTVQMDRIAMAILAAKDAKGINEHLRYLAGGSLDVFSRRPSKAKNTLWELELYGLFSTRGLSAELAEPDILAQIDGSPVGVACKRCYSEKNIGKTLSEGVEQIEDVSEYGVLAINLDDLWPPNQLRKATSEEELGHSLQQENTAFLERNHRHFHKYLATGRVMGAMVASGGIAYVGDEITNTRQFSVWMIPGLPPRKLEIMNALEGVLQDNWTV